MCSELRSAESVNGYNERLSLQALRSMSYGILLGLFVLSSQRFSVSTVAIFFSDSHEVTIFLPTFPNMIECSFKIYLDVWSVYCDINR